MKKSKQILQKSFQIRKENNLLLFLCQCSYQPTLALTYPGKAGRWLKLPTQPTCFRCSCGTAALSCSLWPTHISEQGRGNSIIPFGYHNSNVLENLTKAKLNDADRKFGKFSASALFIFCEPNFLLGNPKGTDIWSFELHK